MPTTVDHDRSVAATEQRGNLVATVATVAKAAKQHDNGWAGAVTGIPDSCAVVLDISFIVCRRQWRGAIRRKPAEVIIIRIHGNSPHHTCASRCSGTVIIQQMYLTS